VSVTVEDTALLLPKILPCEQSLEAQLSGAIAQDSVET
jgi:hypothetical protein